MSAPAPGTQVFATQVFRLHVGLYCQTAAFVMLIYDHILTFPDEVERIWRQQFSGVTLLFLLNRYITPLQCIILIYAMYESTWTKTVCDHFVVFEGASLVALVGVCELVMILRVYALYERRTVILTFLLVLWAVQISVSAFALHSGHAIPMPPSPVGCFLTVPSPAFPTFWVTPLITDTCIFALTMYRTRNYVYDSGKMPAIRIFLRDGTLYFFVIFMANLTTTLCYFLAPPGMEAVGYATFNQLITSTMTSRIVLNLRSLSTPPTTDDVQLQSNSYSRPHGHRAKSLRVVTRTSGNLGEDPDSFYSPASTHSPNGKLEDMPVMNICSSDRAPV